MKDGYYFPHFQDARRDIKILRVRRDLGIEGYGIFFMLLETLRKQSDFSFPLDDMDVLVNEINSTKAKIEAVINLYDLFEVKENEEGRSFFSPKQIQYLLPYIEKKEQMKLANAKSNLARKEKVKKQLLELSNIDSTSQEYGFVKFSQVNSTSYN